MAYRCMSWLEENHPALFAKYYSESTSAASFSREFKRSREIFASLAGALEDKLAHLTVDQRKALEKDLAKKEKKEEAKAEKEKAKMSVRFVRTLSPPYSRGSPSSCAMQLKGIADFKARGC